MRQMTAQEAREFIGHNKTGVLSLADRGKAYGVPLYYGYDGREIFIATRHGLKDQYLRMTNEACFTIVRATGLDDWASVQVFGALERVAEGPERIHAHQALMSVPLPPEWGESTFGEPLRSEERMAIYRLHATDVQGRYSEPPKRSREEREIALGGM